MDLEESRGFWWPALSMDDQLWVRSILAARQLQMRKTTMMSPERQSLYRLMSAGLCDVANRNRPHVSSTRSMRYAACLADHLWSLLEAEHERVWDFPLPILFRKTDAFLQGDCLKMELSQMKTAM